MRIDRVGVEQVELHLPHDAAEFSQVVAKDAVTTHVAQLLRHADWAAQNLQERLLVLSVRTKSVVHQVSVVANQADGGSRNPDNFFMCSAQQEHFQQSL